MDINQIADDIWEIVKADLEEREGLEEIFSSIDEGTAAEMKETNITAIKSILQKAIQ